MMNVKKNKDKNSDCDEAKEGAWAAAGFALVLVVVGLPVWWSTTTVYRASLPYSTIDNLASRSAYQAIPLHVFGENPLILKQDLEKYLDMKGLIQFFISGHQSTVEERNILLSNSSFEEMESSLNKLTNFDPGTLNVYFVPRTKNHDKPRIFVGCHRLVIASSLIDVNELADTLNEMSLDPLASDFLNQKHERLLDIKRPPQRTSLMRQVPTEPGYDITLTLMLPQPQIRRAKWDVQNAIKAYLHPILSQMKEILDLRVRSQVLYMTSLKVTPKWSEEHGHYALPEQQLPLTINAIEAKLGSFVSTRPSLHFIIYIPLSDQTPLVIHTKENLPLESNSFLVPRWGGVLIHNPPKDVTHIEDFNSTSYPQEFTLDSHWIMSTVITQLHKLFPIPLLEQHPPLSYDEEFLFADWQIDSLARARIIMYLNNIKITLQSLGELVGEISNMVISDEVAGWVWAAVQEWEECLAASVEGRLKDATFYCKRAFANSDAAFFHPSMLALLYFPDNQKYAIYVPLFLPVSIPVILSFRMIYKYFASPEKEKEKEQ